MSKNLLGTLILFAGGWLIGNVVKGQFGYFTIAGIFILVPVGFYLMLKVGE